VPFVLLERPGILGRGASVKEVTCICGERVVFLDPEVQVKTCPNCGMSVYQYGMATVAAAAAAKSRRRGLSKRVLILAGGLAAALVAVAIIALVSSSRQGAFDRAAAIAREAEAADTRGDFNTAAAAYRKALDVYGKWHAPLEVTSPIQSALRNVQAKLALASGAAGAPHNGLVTVSLEEIARQAYNSQPKAWEASFARDHAGRFAVISGKVEKRFGSAYKASDLTLSYRVFAPSGGYIEISLDSPFFERYRLKPGDSCIMKGVMSKMYLDKGAPGESGHWVLVIDGAKSTLVTETDLLKGLGWKVDDEIENLVASQRALAPAY